MSTDSLSSLPLTPADSDGSVATAKLDAFLCLQRPKPRPNRTLDRVTLPGRWIRPWIRPRRGATTQPHQLSGRSPARSATNSNSFTGAPYPHLGASFLTHDRRSISFARSLLTHVRSARPSARRPPPCAQSRAHSLACPLPHSSQRWVRRTETSGVAV